MRNSLPILDRVPVSSVAKLLKHAFRNRTKELRSEIRVLRSEIDRLREELLNKVTHGSQPNTSKLSLLAKDVDLVKINIKHLGYELCRRELERYGQREQPTPRHVGLICKPASQTEIESDWAA